ncbi:MAG TPA: 1-acyl-sn-glycerol-3-phosphate acyltransferase [Rhodospirillaceae bacterium]|nr:1-acyl-sn-glycerol-3-phosphate acyltransferase [Rhodospirillaceae bacterium]
MIALRSLLYQILFLPWTLAIALAFLPFLAFAQRSRLQQAAVLWLTGAHFLQRRILGLDYEVRGLENLPAGAAILAVKHQSAWDTMVFHHLVGDPAFILKKELLSLPLIGWYMGRSGQVPIDRKAGMKALRLMVEGARQAIAESRKVIIFPEGHRQPPGSAGTYHSGVAMLYAGLNVPVVPIALNSGLFWRRNAFLRYPGKITLEILQPIPAGLERRPFMDLLQNQIETATRALEAEARRNFTNLPPS